MTLPIRMKVGHSQSLVNEIDEQSIALDACCTRASLLVSRQLVNSQRAGGPGHLARRGATSKFVYTVQPPCRRHGGSHRPALGKELGSQGRLRPAHTAQSECS